MMSGLGAWVLLSLSVLACFSHVGDAESTTRWTDSNEVVNVNSYYPGGYCPVSGVYLNHHIYKTYYQTTYQQCALLCDAEAQCHSFNMYQDPSPNATLLNPQCEFNERVEVDEVPCALYIDSSSVWWSKEYCQSDLQPRLQPDPCCDRWNASDCRWYADHGECDINVDWMNQYCASSCQSSWACSKGTNSLSIQQYQDPDCMMWAMRGECTSNRPMMASKCSNTCFRVWYSPNKADTSLDCADWARKGECRDPNLIDTMANMCSTTCFRQWNDLQNNGGDANPDCVPWAQRGECTSNPSMMMNMCRITCFTMMFEPNKYDQSQYCQDWALGGDCEAKPAMMADWCSQTCFWRWRDPMGIDQDPSCIERAGKGECEEPATNAQMAARCTNTCNKRMQASPCRLYDRFQKDQDMLSTYRAFPQPWPLLDNQTNGYEVKWPYQVIYVCDSYVGDQHPRALTACTRDGQWRTSSFSIGWAPNCA